MPPKHKKKSFREKCWHFRSWIGSAAILLAAVYPFYETFETVKNEPKVTQDDSDRRFDVNDLYRITTDLQKQIDQLKTNKVKGK